MAETLAEYQAANGWLVSATLAGGAAIDVIIAASMVHFLVSKKQTGLGQYVFGTFFLG
jgi:gamma-glutamyltranspeptidase